MRRLLIADANEDTRHILKEAFGNRYQVTTCADGITARSYLETSQPELLILDLSLPGLDGLSLMQDLPHRPAVVLALTKLVTDYVEAAAAAFGIDYVMLKPFSLDALVARVDHMALVAGLRHSFADDPEAFTAECLLSMGFQPKLDGFRHLRCGLPIYTAGNGMRMSKELYPAVAKAFGLRSGQLVERSIRQAIQKAWRIGDRKIWAKYFCGDKCPSNKDFITRMAEVLKRA